MMNDTSEKLRQLYATMVTWRRMQDGKLPGGGRPIHRMRFNEASEVGCTIDLRSCDVVVPMLHQNIGRLVQGAPVSELRDSGQNHRCLNGCPTAWSVFAKQPSSSRLSLITGAAVAHKLERTDAVVVAFTSSREIAQSKEALFFALDHWLPIIYVQLNDGRQTGKKRRTKGTQLDPSLTAIPVDRSDVVAIYRVATEAIDRARRGVGPTLIQCLDWLPSRESLPDDSHCSDPVTYMKSYLRRKDLWSDELENMGNLTA